MLILMFNFVNLCFVVACLDFLITIHAEVYKILIYFDLNLTITLNDAIFQPICQITITAES